MRLPAPIAILVIRGTWILCFPGRSRKVPALTIEGDLVVSAGICSTRPAVGDYPTDLARFGDKGKALQYAAWSSAKSGFDCTRALRWMAVIILVPIALFTIPAVPMHTTLHDNELRIHEYASKTTLHYRYDEARRLFLVDGMRDRSGKFTPRAEVVVDSADGRRWESADNRDFEPQADPGLAEFLVEKTGLQLSHVRADKDLPQVDVASK